MRIRESPRVDLTYCLNVHPGETWAENLAAVRAHVPEVRRRLGRGGAFGLGLRLSRQAAEDLRDRSRRYDFRRWMEDSGLYAFTVNGFPYGRFHGTHVKENVYRPDWRDPERAAYTSLLAEILADLLPEGVSGSISTVPGSYKAWVREAADVEAMVWNLADAAARLARLREDTGREIAVALEPEPDCFLETTDEAIAFFRGPLREAGIRRIAEREGVPPERAEEWIAAHLGICFDTCHMALQFEELAVSLSRLRAAGIRIPKVQLSSALRTVAGSPDGAGQLARFEDPVYLHQVKARGEGGVVRGFPDLRQALGADAHAGAECRVHFHVPLYFEGNQALKSTADSLTPAFFRLLREGVAPHLEIETYTFGVLPETVTSLDVDASIALEYAWALARM